MPTYRFHLHSDPQQRPAGEEVEAFDDEEARALAEMRLLLTSAFIRIEVSRDGVSVLDLRRDSAPRNHER